MINNNLNNKKKNIFLSIGVIMLGLLVGGATYAFLINGMNIYNGNYLYNTSCFNIFYDIANDGGETNNLSGTLEPSHNAFGGLSGNITIGMSAECNLKATGNIYFLMYDMNNYNAASKTYIQPVKAHCEDSNTLETLVDYTTESQCVSQANAEWVTEGTALKYAVYDSDNMSNSPLKVGYVNTYDESINMYNFAIDATFADDTDEDTIIDYYVYIWLDGNLSDNTYSSMSFRGHIYADVIQQET